MKISRPKLILGLFLAAAILLFSYPFFKQPPKATASIIYKENKFNLNFQIPNQDRQNYLQALAQLNLPQSTLSGVQFQLDSTSSAKLAFVSPVKVNLNLNNQNLDFWGRFDKPPQSTTFDQKLNLKIPNTAVLTIFAPDFKSFIKGRFLLPKNFSAWLDENLNSSTGQYLIIFDNQPDFALVLKPSHAIDFSGLQSLNTADIEGSSYKEETQDNVTFHLLNIPQTKEKTTTFTFFQMGDFAYLTSSLESAKVLRDSEKGNGSYVHSFNQKSGKIATALFFRNADLEETTKAVNFLTGNDEKVTNIILKIKEAEFLQEDKNFSGYIKL